MVKERNGIMKELNMPKEIYFEEFDIKVRPYLLMDEIVAIGETMLGCEDYIEREMTKIFNVLVACTDLEEDVVRELDIDEVVQSGLWETVEKHVSNIFSIDDYIYHQEDWERAIARFLNTTLPNMVDKYVDRLPKDGEWEEVIENLPKSLNEVLELAKEDGNADIIRNAIKMNTLDGGDE